MFEYGRELSAQSVKYCYKFFSKLYYLNSSSSQKRILKNPISAIHIQPQICFGKFWVFNVFLNNAMYVYNKWDIRAYH